MDRAEKIEKFEEISACICDELCKYRTTCDDENICDYQRQLKQCPIDILWQEVIR